MHNSEAMECGIKFAIIAFLSTTDGRCDGHDSALFESSAECATTEGYGRHLDDEMMVVLLLAYVFSTSHHNENPERIDRG